MATQEPPTYKIVLIGDGTVGKTSLREQFMGRGFPTNYIMTIGANVVSKTVKLPSSNKTVVFQIWDLAGQPHFQSIRSLYYRGSHGALLVYDITRKSSYDNAMSWIKECWKKVGRQIPFVLLGNKTDLRGQEVCIPISDGHKLAKEIEEALGFPTTYYETSALTGANVDKTFIFLGELIETYKEQIKDKKRNGLSFKP
ncbi:MAG: GTP-binding protein [Candidatus Hodarchaeota archaeon]